MMERAHDPELKIAERYFLGELTDDDAEAFEAHYFECPRCAEYVVEELAMLESGREVARAVQPAQPANVVPLRPPRRVTTWLPAAAAAMLVLVVGAPLLIPDRPEPTVDSPEPIPIQLSQNRAFAALAEARPEGAPVLLDVEIPREAADFPQFELTVRSQANEVVDKPRTYPAERATEHILLVLRALPAGTYNVAIEGVREDGNRSHIATSQPFEVRGEPSKEGEP